MKNFPLLLLILLSLFLFRCNDEPDYIIHPDLQAYFDRFQKEAADRNVIINFSDPMIEADIVEIVTGGVLGQCVRLENANHLIHIQKGYWNNSETTEMDKEFVMFHELGHCTLLKDHLNTPDSTGTCVSIMYDGNSAQCNLVYNAANRTEMLDELFK